jgi:hypothetical protein
MDQSLLEQSGGDSIRSDFINDRNQLGQAFEEMVSCIRGFWGNLVEA